MIAMQKAAAAFGAVTRYASILDTMDTEIATFLGYLGESNIPSGYSQLRKLILVRRDAGVKIPFKSDTIETICHAFKLVNGLDAASNAMSEYLKGKGLMRTFSIRDASSDCIIVEHNLWNKARFMPRPPAPPAETVVLTNAVAEYYSVPANRISLGKMIPSKNSALVFTKVYVKDKSNDFPWIKGNCVSINIHTLEVEAQSAPTHRIPVVSDFGFEKARSFLQANSTARVYYSTKENETITLYKREGELCFDERNKFGGPEAERLRELMKQDKAPFKGYEKYTMYEYFEKAMLDKYLDTLEFKLDSDGYKILNSRFFGRDKSDLIDGEYNPLTHCAFFHVTSSGVKNLNKPADPATHDSILATARKITVFADEGWSKKSYVFENEAPETEAPKIADSKALPKGNKLGNQTGHLVAAGGAGASHLMVAKPTTPPKVSTGGGAKTSGNKQVRFAGHLMTETKPTEVSWSKDVTPSGVTKKASYSAELATADGKESVAVKENVAVYTAHSAGPVLDAIAAHKKQAKEAAAGAAAAPTSIPVLDAMRAYKHANKRNNAGPVKNKKQADEAAGGAAAPTAKAGPKKTAESKPQPEGDKPGKLMDVVGAGIPWGDLATGGAAAPTADAGPKKTAKSKPQPKGDKSGKQVGQLMAAATSAATTVPSDTTSHCSQSSVQRGSDPMGPMISVKAYKSLLAMGLTDEEIFVVRK